MDADVCVKRNPKNGNVYSKGNYGIIIIVESGNIIDGDLGVLLEVLKISRISVINMLRLSIWPPRYSKEITLSRYEFSL